MDTSAVPNESHAQPSNQSLLQQLLNSQQPASGSPAGLLSLLVPPQTDGAQATDAPPLPTGGGEGGQQGGADGQQQGAGAGGLDVVLNRVLNGLEAVRRCELGQQGVGGCLWWGTVDGGAFS